MRLLRSRRRAREEGRVGSRRVLRVCPHWGTWVCKCACVCTHAKPFRACARSAPLALGPESFCHPEQCPGTAAAEEELFAQLCFSRTAPGWPGPQIGAGGVPQGCWMVMYARPWGTAQRPPSPATSFWRRGRRWPLSGVVRISLWGASRGWVRVSWCCQLHLEEVRNPILSSISQAPAQHLC